MNNWFATKIKYTPKIPPTKTVIFFPVLALAILAIIATITFNRYSNEVHLQSSRSLKDILMKKREALNRYLDERKNDALIMSERPSIQRYFAAQSYRSSNTSNLKTIIAQTTRAYGYSRILLVNRSLEGIWPKQANYKQNITVALRNAIQSGTAQLVDIFDEDDGKSYWGIAQPVILESRLKPQIAGAIYLEIEVNRHIYPIISTWPQQSASAESLLLRRQDDHFRYLTPFRNGTLSSQLIIHPELSHSLYLANENANLHQPSLIEGKDYRGIEVIGAVAAVDGTSWILEVKVDKSEINRPIHEFGLFLLLVGVAFSIFVFISGWLFWKAKKDKIKLAYLADRRKIEAIGETSIDGFLEVDTKGRILAVNEPLVEMTGYSRDELLKMSLFDLEAKMSAAEILTALDNLAIMHSVRFNSQWKRKNGELLDIAVGVKFLNHPDGDRCVSYIRDIGPELKTRHKFERLNQFYRFLSNVNASIFNATNEEQIYSAICEYAVKDSAFALAWVGVLDEKAGRVIPRHAYGAAAEYVDGLIITTDLTLPSSHGPTHMAMVEKKIVYTDNFQKDPQTLPWHDLGHQYGLNSSAAAPIIIDGKAIAALTFYSNATGFFDDEMRELLQEVTRNASLALQAVHAGKKLNAAEIALKSSNEKFQQIFEESPVPMQIYSFASRKLVAINLAHQKTFGYRPEEIPDEKSWFEKVYPEEKSRNALQKKWNQDLHRAGVAGDMTIVTSPAIPLRCKDGTERILKGFMSIADDSIIVQWQDLTEIKRSEALLIENEKRFRSMVEQTITGIYVTQHDKIAYINPRMSEIVGWRTEDMLGKDSLEFFAHDDESRRNVAEARSSLYAGAESVSLNLSFHRKDGKEIILGIHASVGYWNGGPAIIVMAQDITEKQRAEEIIKEYIRQLEGTMEGTLRAVANMVELRDPYTSGHERRVGMIAADIAHEMGWPENKCNSLRLIGLVHDIGKIAVPAEILTKPTRLTALEYEMVKSHAEKGYEILKDVEFPLPIAEIIREHHERLDGTGYPQGLKGEQILIEARIIAVADVLESMAAHRPYRPALGIDAALNEILSHSGTWFDPDVVNALVSLMQKKNYKLPAD